MLMHSDAYDNGMTISINVSSISISLIIIDRSVSGVPGQATITVPAVPGVPGGGV